MFRLESVFRLLLFGGVDYFTCESAEKAMRNE